MFHQLLTPIGGSLSLSFFIGVLPIATVLVLLGVFRRPAWQASLTGLIIGVIVAMAGWHFPAKLVASSVLEGTAFALWPILWIPFSALLLYNLTVSSGHFDALRSWLLVNLPNDRRVVVVVIGFCFGALLEGVAGSGTPVAIGSALLISVGWSPLEAVVMTLIFDTAPVAFGALGLPVTILSLVTHLPSDTLAAMMGRQLPVLAFLLPFYVLGLFGGKRSIRELWPLLTVAGGTFAITQFIGSNFLNYGIVDVLSSLVSLVATIAFLQVWKPVHNPEFAIHALSPACSGKTTGHDAALDESATRHRTAAATWKVWMPWAMLSAIVTVWTLWNFSKIGQIEVNWPVLHNAVYITVYKRIYAAVWSFQPLSTGTAVFATALAFALAARIRPGLFLRSVARTWEHTRFTLPTVVCILSLAYLMNYSGITYSLGLGAASLGVFFTIASAFLGWTAVFLTGSDTSGNALFGNLQVVAARQLHLDPVLFAATNSTGGVMGKMISPQNVSIGASTTSLRGNEGTVFAKAFSHSVLLTLLIAFTTLLFQFVFPSLIPH
ncbi:L-lactate permease [Paraburkholderia youngii]|uniref:L-lactate permease n=1 Tax=Paraburkholderia youngii TaxID=2782701 RepID=UPI003D1CD3BE